MCRISGSAHQPADDHIPHKRDSGGEVAPHATRDHFPSARDQGEPSTRRQLAGLVYRRVSAACFEPSLAPSGLSVTKRLRLPELESRVAYKSL